MPNPNPAKKIEQKKCRKCGSRKRGMMLIAYSFRYGRWREIDERSCDPGRNDHSRWHKEIEDEEIVMSEQSAIPKNSKRGAVTREREATKESSGL